MYKLGEHIRYREPLDADYTYGDVEELKAGKAVVRIIGFYHTGYVVEIPYRYMEHVKKRR